MNNIVRKHAKLKRTNYKRKRERSLKLSKYACNVTTQWSI